MVQLDRITKRFGSQLLFQGLSWTIPQGTRLGLVGPNGAGKTTILRLLAGLDTPDAGECRVPSAVRVGYLPQEVETLPEGSVLSTVLDGFPELRKLEEELESLERRLSDLGPDDPELPKTVSTYGAVRDRFERLGGDRVEAKAKAILTGLGVGADKLHASLLSLSGGWRMRVVLARLLLGAPGLLLLDEPTNHLDLDAIAWLESFLESYEGSFVVVSHDRYFLNRMVRGIVELERGRITTFPGNYEGYLEEKAARDEALEEAKRLQDREVARVERFVERFRYKATKARQVQSRLKALEKIERIEAPSRARRIRFGFPSAPRSGDVVVRAESVDKAYGETTVFRGLDLLLRRGDRVALVGPNGAGKSTLLKLLAGRARADGGILELGHNVDVRYFAQHQLEALEPGNTVLEEVGREADASVRPRLRSLLGCFLFSGDDVEKKVAVLSGGEKARLALAKMLLRPSNLLLLDEPTNHLDLRSREVLEDALEEYGGTLVVISHDRYFINRVATSIGEVGGGRIEIYAGDYDTYLEHLEARRAASEPPADPRAAPDAAPKGRTSRREEAEERNRRYREKKAIEDRLRPIETEIDGLERRVRELEAMQADPSVYSDAAKAQDVGREKARAEERLHALYWEWESAAKETQA